MSDYQDHAIVFYGDLESCLRFIKEETDENLEIIFTLEDADELKYKIRAEVEVLQNEENCYLRLNLSGPFEGAIFSAVSLMKQITYLRSIALIRNLEIHRNVIFRHDEDGLKDCFESLTIGEVFDTKVFNTTVMDDFEEDVESSPSLQFASNWIVMPKNLTESSRLR
ncbi:hypothetical protein [Zwartia vadi]|uniref:hypothetical protein n=1 Tax=Zwartia vadi TaxID=3058168 RepID=UPI0025B491CF|nr:hypothetical protein [Zwartia vadi]MDN3987397.1 hypothetical protein [Zwartia vadi]